MNYILILCNIVLLLLGQVLWKIGVGKIQLNGFESVIYLVFSPFIIGGVILYILATVIWIYLLSKFPLSFLYPLQSLAYVFGLILAIIIFKEYVPVTRWVGVGIIMIGIYFVAK